ncbi:MAG: GCN5-related N-acetyltransferase [Nocardioides sp.]|nr:GCN5-related N-acetyltransferase [Nocardioides sp.]
MSRKIERLTLDHLEHLPGGCGDCVFWELDPVRREAVRGHEAEEKAAWVSMVLREWGSCGRVAVVDGEIVGHIIWAPPVHVPASNGFATAPVSADAVILTTAYVDPEHRGGGLGRMLMQGMAKDLVSRGGVKAVEAFGDTRGRTGHCVVPADFLLAVGFSTYRAHPVNPRMRMDLRTTLSIREELEKTLERLLAPVKRPAPELGQPTRSARTADDTPGS